VKKQENRSFPNNDKQAFGTEIKNFLSLRGEKYEGRETFSPLFSLRGRCDPEVGGDLKIQHKWKSNSK
jgi:hypothetical protein